MLAGVVSAVRILGENAVLQDCEIVHYGTCGSNVAFALEVNSARNVVVRRNTLRYGCTAYGIGSTDGIVFEHNTLVPSTLTHPAVSTRILGRRAILRTRVPFVLPRVSTRILGRRVTRESPPPQSASRLRLPSPRDMSRMRISRWVFNRF